MTLCKNQSYGESGCHGSGEGGMNKQIVQDFYCRETLLSDAIMVDTGHYALSKLRMYNMKSDPKCK